MSHKIAGTIVQVDQAGNLITDIPSERLTSAPTDDSLRVTVDEHETFGLFAPDHGQPDMTLIAIVAPGEPLTVMLVGDSARAMLGVSVGAAVSVQW
ncbi:MAG: adenosylmethionine-8-amino-7-oxononanoate aminotransferase [Pirellulaceae bacterium]|nr:adenosylmethionine-8-amino-7-oxononanoate aminotransferase [Pirellulaceae bacterium]